MFVVRAHTRRQRRNGEPFLKLQLGDSSGAVEAVIWDEVEALAPVCPAGSVVRILGRYSVDERYGAAVTVKRMRAAGAHEYELGDLTEAPPVSYEEMVTDLEPAPRHDPPAAPEGAARRGSSTPPRRPARPTTRRLRRSTTTRPTGTGCSSTACRWRRACTRWRRARSSRASTASWPSPARCCTTSARPRSTRPSTARSSSRTTGSCSARSRSATTSVRREIERIDGFPAVRGRGPPAHHPQPPRQAGARQPRRPVHARGHARPLRGQPGRQPRQLRPHRADARRRRELVRLRPRALDVRLLRPAREGAARRGGVASIWATQAQANGSGEGVGFNRPDFLESAGLSWIEPRMAALGRQPTKSWKAGRSGPDPQCRRSPRYGES